MPARRRAGIWDRIVEALAAGHDAAVQMVDTSVVRMMPTVSGFGFDRYPNSELLRLHPACVDPAVLQALISHYMPKLLKWMSKSLTHN